MLKKLGLGLILVTSTTTAVMACSSVDAEPVESEDSGAIDGSRPPTTDAAPTVDSATADASKDSAVKPDASDAAAQCSTTQYWNGSECKPCSGACAAGSHLTAACSASADRVCSECTQIPNCAAETCTSATNQTCTACANNHYLSANACQPCSGACPLGQQLTAACSATTDRVCTSCTPIPNCMTIACSNAMDQVCSACSPGYYLSGNACVACSGACPSGEYASTACAAAADRVCSACTTVAQCSSALTCASATTSQCTACSSGYYLVDGAADSCAACTAITNCSSVVTCTSATTEQCTACAAGYVLVDGVADSCALPKTCAELKRSVPGTADGTYMIDPDGAGAMAPFSVYCDMTNDGGGWTLIGKVGNGTWPELTNQQYIDLVANPTSDIGGALLTSGAMPATKEIAFFRRDKTNAIYRATPYAGQSAVRVLFDSAENNTVDGTYFQQRKVADAAWDFWAALRDSRRWSTAPSVAPNVSNFGTNFALTRLPGSFDAATNTVTHSTGGDVEFGWWDSATLTLADATTLAVSRHGGLLCDGVNGYGWLWLLTLNPSDSRFKNESFASKSTIWVR